MIYEALPDIPRWLTGLAEWLACLLYVVLINRNRLRGWRLILTTVVALPALLGVQLLAGTLPIALWVVGMSAAVLVMFWFIAVATKLSTRDAVFLTARAFVLAELIASLQWQIHTFVFDLTTPFNLFEVALGVIIYTLSLVGAFALERRHILGATAFSVTVGEAGSAAAIAAITFFMSNISFLTANTPFSARLGQEVFIIRTLVCIAGFVALYAQQGQRLALRARDEAIALDDMLHHQYLQYEQSKRNIDHVNRTYHDLKHQIEVIREEADPAKRQSYLDDLESTVSGFGAQKNTGNPVLDVILTTKALECADSGIDFMCVVDGDALSFVSTLDLAALFGNALDNAIEAVTPVRDPERRLIKLAVYAKGQFVLITCDNYFLGELVTSDGVILTRKKDRLRHGFGLTSIRRTAEKYGGSMTVSAQDNWFTVRILLPKPAPSIP